MRYIYMHNFRGFSNTLIPLSQISFLVGENSTGKSSFLKLLYLLSRPHFLFSPEFMMDEDNDLGSFHDIVSAWAVDKSYFQVGAIRTRDNKGELDINFSILTFIEKDGAPELSQYIYCADKKITILRLEDKTYYYKIVEVQRSLSEEEIPDYFLEVVSSHKKDTTDFKQFPNDALRGVSRVPVAFAFAMLQNIEGGKKTPEFPFLEIPYIRDLVWIAPIRTKPLRFYDGLKRSFSPEGDHVPFILRRSLETQTKSSRFVKKLRAFGRASGLFETVVARSFEETPQAPFELLIKFSGVELNINNVGYGVSQVLPLIVEFLTQEKNKTFAVQQPEVHIHPRAQAALGDLIYELAKERNHFFLLETHSDYLIDRFRLAMNSDGEPTTKAQIIFFHRVEDGNHAYIIPISPEGRYPADQPEEFREFFIKEEMALLEI